MVQQEGKEGGGKRRRRNTSTKEVPDVRKEMRRSSVSWQNLQGKKAAKGRNPRQSAM